MIIDDFYQPSSSGEHSSRHGETPHPPLGGLGGWSYYALADFKNVLKANGISRKEWAKRAQSLDPFHYSFQRVNLVTKALRGKNWCPDLVERGVMAFIPHFGVEINPPKVRWDGVTGFMVKQYPRQDLVLQHVPFQMEDILLSLAVPDAKMAEFSGCFYCDDWLRVLRILK